MPGPRREQIIRLQGQVDKHYAGLKEAAKERHRCLENTYHLFQLKREVEDLEQWIKERSKDVSSQEMGEDLDDVTVRALGRARGCQRGVLGGGAHSTLLSSVQLLRKKFREFALETGSVGQKRVDWVNLTIEDLIDAGHTEAATMAEWKDGLNESWADLLELFDTCLQLFAASHDLHKYFYDGAELLDLITTRHKELPQDLGEDASSVVAFHRMHSAFERDLHLLENQVMLDPRAGTAAWHRRQHSASPAFSGSTGLSGSPALQVQQFWETASRLQTFYAGDKAASIQEQKQKVAQALQALLEACSRRRAWLGDMADKHRFFSMARDLLCWMESTVRQIETQEKPRYGGAPQAAGGVCWDPPPFAGTRH